MRIGGELDKWGAELQIYLQDSVGVILEFCPDHYDGPKYLVELDNAIQRRHHLSDLKTVFIDQDNLFQSPA